MRPSMKWLAFKWSALAILPLALSGCFGGTIAQQLAGSLLMQGADKATAAAIDAHERNQTLMARNTPLKDSAPDEFQMAFLRAGFEPIQAPIQLQVEPLPPATVETETPIQVMQESKLVSVEVWNLLIGDEKQHMLEKARLQGSAVIPPQEEWSQWQIAVGATENHQPGNKQQAITFLIPPDIGKIRSGAKALVELSSAGELSIARYTMN